MLLWWNARTVVRRSSTRKLMCYAQCCSWSLRLFRRTFGEEHCFHHFLLKQLDPCHTRKIQSCWWYIQLHTALWHSSACAPSIVHPIEQHRTPSHLWHCWHCHLLPFSLLPGYIHIEWGKTTLLYRLSSLFACTSLSFRKFFFHASILEATDFTALAMRRYMMATSDGSRPVEFWYLLSSSDTRRELSSSSCPDSQLSLTLVAVWVQPLAARPRP